MGANAPEPGDHGPYQPPSGVRGEPINHFEIAKHPSEQDSLEFSELIAHIRNPETDRCIRFESAEGGHFVRAVDDGQFVAVYAGPHGPENRPARINRKSLRYLFRETERIDLVDTKDTPFREISVRATPASENG